MLQAVTVTLLVYSEDDFTITRVWSRFRRGTLYYRAGTTLLQTKFRLQESAAQLMDFVRL